MPNTIYPIIAYGDAVLRKIALNIDADYPEVQKLIKDMHATMKASYGVGLAAPQIGLSIRIFVVDATHMAEDEDATEEEKGLASFKKTFINAQMLEESGDKWAFNEGCLSIPNIREDVSRKDKITIQYLDENFKEKTETYSGIAARIIQHEYDHLQGKLFIDHLSPLKKKMLQKELDFISQGKVKTDYKMVFVNKKKGR